jgi:aminopeptidase N
MPRLTLFIFFFIIVPLWVYCQNQPSIEVLKELSKSEQKVYHARMQALAPTHYIGSDYNLSYHRFTWNIDPNIRYIQGSVVSYFTPIQPGVDQISFELYHGMTIDSIIFHGTSVNYELTASDELRIFLGQQLSIGMVDSVAVYYQGEPNENNGFGSFTQSNHNGSPIIWTFSEPYGAKDWWPCKNDLSDKIDSIDIIVTTPMQYRVAGNGILADVTTVGDSKTYHWKHRYPIATYLIAIAVTDYVAYSDFVPVGSDSIEVLNYVFPEHLQTVQSMTPDIIAVMQLYIDLFTPYPFIKEKYGHAEWLLGGAMEHQTMTFTGNFGHEIMAHELAHQWFGDMVTLASWHDIWLNEGFATYLTGLTYEHLFNGYYWPIWKNNNISYTTSAPDGSVYCNDTTSIARIFDPRLSYSKGAMILHLLRWVIGDSAFFSALQNYLTDPLLAYRYATSDDAKRHFEASSGRDLTGFFDDWYLGEGYPVYSIICTYKDQDKIEVTINQSQTNPSVDFFELPIPVFFKGADRDTLLVFDNKFSGQIFIADPGFHVDSVFFDPDQWIITRNSSIILGVEGSFTSSGFLVFPNPSTQDIRISAGGMRLDKIELISLSGSACISLNVAIPSYGIFKLEPGGIKPGIYIVKVYHGNRIFTRKIIRL